MTAWQILAPNCVEFVIAFFGIVKAGAIVTTVNSGYREREIAHQLNDSGAETLVVHAAIKLMSDAARSEIPSLTREIVISRDSSDPDSFWGLLENASRTPPTIAVDPTNDVAVLPYSSGTTGLSKGGDAHSPQLSGERPAVSEPKGRTVGDWPR